MTQKIQFILIMSGALLATHYSECMKQRSGFTVKTKGKQPSDAGIDQAISKVAGPSASSGVTPISREATFAPMPKRSAPVAKTRLDPAKRQAVTMAKGTPQSDARNIASQQNFEQFGVAGTHYDTLGVAQNVSDVELANAYRKLQTHMQAQIKRAEASNQNDAANKLKMSVRQQKLAYDVLGYPVKRAAYDKTLKN